MAAAVVKATMDLAPDRLEGLQQVKGIP